MRIGSLVLLVWLVIGFAAAVQRGYLSSEEDVDCADVNVDVNLPEPSK